MIPKAPDSSNTRSHSHKLDTLTSYPYKPLILSLDRWATDVLQITPKPNRFGNDDYVVWINNVIYENLYTGTESTITLSTAAIGGLVDGLAVGSGLDMLYWAFANEQNNGFLGFGATHKPYSAYTGPATAAKGASVSFTGLTNAYQFTIGARVCVRNTVGTAPSYEWNWGTITAIVSSTSITVTMDNNANYGVALSGVTGGEILQWNKFRPWVVTASGQTLYTPNYRLIGYGLNSGANIRFVTPSFEEQFPVNITTVYNATGVATGSALSLGRWIPLWAKGAYLGIEASSTVVAGHTVTILRRAAVDIIARLYAQIASGTNTNYAETMINQYATIYITVAGASWSTITITMNDYHLPGGFPE